MIHGDFANPASSFPPAICDLPRAATLFRPQERDRRHQEHTFSAPSPYPAQICTYHRGATMGSHPKQADIAIRPAINPPVQVRSLDDDDATAGGRKRKPTTAKRRKVNHACLYCRRSHMTCDEGRPCQRWSAQTFFCSLEVCTNQLAYQYQEGDCTPLPRRAETFGRCEGEGSIHHCFDHYFNTNSYTRVRAPNSAQTGAIWT